MKPGTILTIHSNQIKGCYFNPERTVHFLVPGRYIVTAFKHFNNPIIRSVATGELFEPWDLRWLGEDQIEEPE